ncbi:hypothetical protein D8674_006260 [Pyrus ussuriensis x Pyrus communis]|uniref:Uncharacterized protein n=1 Tax=Pyrus ussuriensis x Pyrus communis TaxID=2448454 RepID=A0A5N5FU39_9ROSA|nr:hypothetical protein D8674_006260 [Pyrus ussuriensis x Pyrus communis]
MTDRCHRPLGANNAILQENEANPLRINVTVVLSSMVVGIGRYSWVGSAGRKGFGLAGSSLIFFPSFLIGQFLSSFPSFLFSSSYLSRTHGTHIAAPANLEPSKLVVNYYFTPVFNH